MRTRRSAVLATALLAIGTALGQSLPGPFGTGTPWTIPVGTDSTGTFYDIGGTLYAIPVDLIGAQAFRNAAGDIVRVSRSAAFDCPASSVPGRTPAEVTFLAVQQNPAALQLLRSVCVRETIAQDGYYDGLSSGSPQRIAYIVERGDLTGAQVIHWIDLTSGGLSTSPFAFHPAVDDVSFAPSGNLALVRHGVSGTTDYDLVDLCPGVLGGDLTPGAGLDDLGPGVTGEITNVGGGLFDLVLNQGGSPLQTFVDISDCLAAGPIDGACCLGDGSCAVVDQAGCAALGGSWLGVGTACGDCPPPAATGACCIGQSCVPEVPQADCENAGGTWEGAGSDCSACPMPAFTISKSAAATATAGDVLTYSIAYENIGDAATGTVLQDFLPAGTSFVSASNGGTLVGTRVEWNLGNVPAGATGDVTLTVSVPCGADEVVNSNYLIRAGIVVAAGAPLSTPVVSGPATPLDLVATVLPSRTPLQRGDTVRYDLTLTNTEPEMRRGVTFSLNFGDAVRFGQVLDDGGGTVQLSGTFGLVWTGDLPASASRTVSFEALVDDCTTRPSTQLNFGSNVLVRDGCNQSLGQIEPPGPIAIELPLRVEMRAPALGPPQQFFGSTAIQAARAGGTYDLELTLTNDGDGPQALSVVAPIPDAWTIAGDPFVPPTDPGARYDAALREVHWNGTLAAESQAVVTFRATLDPNACRTFLTLRGSTAGCTNDINSSLTLLLVPEPPAGPYLTQTVPFEGIHRWLPSAEPVLCLTPEIYTGMGSGPNGDLWLAGLPNVRINPGTLAFDILDGGDFSGTSFPARVLGVTPFAFVRDVAVDPRDGTAIFVGESQGTGGVGAVGRYDIDSDTATPLVADARLRNLRRVAVAPDGVIAVAGAVGGDLALIDPNDPNALQFVDDPNVAAAAVAVDGAGDLLVLSSLPPKLARYDRVAGTFATVADLTGFIGAGSFVTGLAVNGGTAYVSYSGPGGLRIDLGTVPPQVTLFNFGPQTADIAFAAGAGVCPDLDASGEVSLRDLAIVLSDYGNPGPGAPGDADGDGDTDMDDLSAVLAAFGTACP